MFYKEKRSFNHDGEVNSSCFQKIFFLKLFLLEISKSCFCILVHNKNTLQRTKTGGMERLNNNS